MRRKTFFTKISFLLASPRSMTKIAGSGSISQRHGSADPEPYQYVMDPQHCLIGTLPVWLGRDSRQCEWATLPSPPRWRSPSASSSRRSHPKNEAHAQNVRVGCIGCWRPPPPPPISAAKAGGNHLNEENALVLFPTGKLYQNLCQAALFLMWTPPMHESAELCWTNSVLPLVNSLRTSEVGCRKGVAFAFQNEANLAEMFELKKIFLDI